MSGSLSDLVTLVDKVREMNQRQMASLTEYTKGTNIINRLYIENSVADDDIAVPLIGTMNQLICAYVFTALSLQNLVTGTRTVRNLLELVSSEAYVDAVELINNEFGDSVLDKPVVSVEGSSVVNLDPSSQRLISGRVLDVDIGIPGPDGKVNSLTVRIYVQLVPYILTPDIMQEFVSLNFNPSQSLRWKQVKAGELSFWSDFVFARDLVNKQAEALKKDETGVLFDMMVRQKNALARYITNLTPFGRENHNTASTILVFDKRTINSVMEASYVDFSRQADRERFFKRTFSMIVCIVDVAYGQVEMYFNGINVKGVYPFSMINKLAVGKDSMDLKEVMTAFSQGTAPKF